MMYFKDCKTLEEVKTVYRKLAKENHPDAGGSTETMQAINKEYAFVCARLVKGANLTEEETEKQMRFSEEYREVIEKIIHLEGITIELVGMWIWVTGNTYPLKKQLREAGFFFASKKVAWYYRSEFFKVSRSSKKTLDQIRSKYGSEKINGKEKIKRVLEQD